MKDGQDGEWIKVRDFSELFRGCVVRIFCGWCRRNEICFCLNLQDATSRMSNGEWSTGAHWYLSKACRYGADVISGASVEKGVVYRLRPDEPVASDETATPVKVRETVEVRS